MTVLERGIGLGMCVYIEWCYPHFWRHSDDGKAAISETLTSKFTTPPPTTDSAGDQAGFFKF